MHACSASLVVQMPGWTGLANARVTIFGDVSQLPPELQPVARDVFLQKHANERKERWVSGNFVYFRMNRIVDIYFVGGFGTVQWLDPAEYLSASPDEILLANPNHILQVGRAPALTRAERHAVAGALTPVKLHTLHERSDVASDGPTDPFTRTQACSHGLRDGWRMAAGISACAALHTGHRR